MLTPRGMSAIPTVLIVEDELLIRWALGERLVAAGYRVVEAEDGRSAREAYGAGIDAVVLDLRLPDTSGIELLRHFKRAIPTVHVLLMSAYATPEVELEAMRLGAAAVVGKPFEVDEMVARVTALLA
ncbi:hypothetical protein LBMAG42_03740 [Deltaproteobacteria bacterium]|nr:hypothetical protein LBMAG42_03740 [Deltaproteobacteria bacterium]